MTRSRKVGALAYAPRMSAKGSGSFDESAERDGVDEGAEQVDVDERGESKFQQTLLVSVITATATALLTALGTGGIGLLLAHQEAQREDEVALREARAEVYSEYLNAVDAYATSQYERRMECETDTNNAISPDHPCTVMLDDLQEDRFAYQTATSNMYVYGTAEALELVNGFQGYFSGSSYTGEWDFRTGDQSEYNALYSEFLDQMRTDIDSI